MPRRDGAVMRYTGEKAGMEWRLTTTHADTILDDIEEELDKAEPGATLTFTVKVGEA